MGKESRSAFQVMEILKDDPVRLEKIKNDPKEFEKVVDEAIIKNDSRLPNNRIYRMVVSFLGAVAVLALIGAIVLAAMGKTTEVVTSLGAVAVGALAGTLVPQSKDS